jgi:hypothetical protein
MVPLNIVTYVKDCRRGLVWWLDLLNSYAHNSTITACWFTHYDVHCNCSTHKVFYVLTRRFLVTDPNNVLWLCPYRLANIPQQTHFSNWLIPRLAAISHQPPSLLVRDWQTAARFESYVTTEGQSASLSWNKAPIWGLRPDLYYCQTVAGVLMWGALSDDRTGLSFTIAAGPRQRSHSRARIPWDSQRYFTISDSRIPFLSPSTTRRVTVEVFDFASTREWLHLPTCPACNISARTAQKTPFLIFVVQSLPCEHVCVLSRYSATALAYLLISRSLPSIGCTYYNIFLLKKSLYFEEFLFLTRIGKIRNASEFMP